MNNSESPERIWISDADAEWHTTLPTFDGAWTEYRRVSPVSGGFTCPCCQRNAELLVNGFCNECSIGRAVLPVEQNAEGKTWATIACECNFCGQMVQHVCTAFLKEHSVNAESDPSLSTAAIPKDIPVKADQVPLCDVHLAIENRHGVEVVYGNNCVACSLNERAELLELLAEHLQSGRPWDSVAFLRHVLGVYASKPVTSDKRDSVRTNNSPTSFNSGSESVSSVEGIAREAAEKIAREAVGAQWVMVTPGVVNQIAAIITTVLTGCEQRVPLSAEIEAIRERRAKITEPPYTVQRNARLEIISQVEPLAGCGWGQAVAHIYRKGKMNGTPYTMPADANADFFAHAPTDIDTLLAVLTSSEPWRLGVEGEQACRDKAQQIVIDSSVASGYADSTWLESRFKHELTDRITAALLPVQTQEGK